MIESPKKRQHYVWRRYLKNWSSSNNSIPTFFKDKCKVQTTDLMNVAQSRFFHKIHCLSQREIDLARSYINSSNNTYANEFAHRLLNIYIKYEYIYIVNETYHKDEEPYSNFSKILKDIELNTFENFMGKLEALGNKLLACNNISDIKALDGIDLYNSLYFISIQYFRTNKTKQSVIKGYGENSEFGILVNKMWNIIFIHLATLFTLNALKRDDYTFVFIKNNSDLNFITGDQPVCNDLIHEGVAENDKEFEFYYPLSPKYAIIIQFGHSNERFKEISVSKDWVKEHNIIIWKNAEKQVFSDSEDTLLEIHNKS